MANTLGIGTSMRCAYHLNQPNATIYELSHLRSNEIPSSPWGASMQYEYSPTTGVPNSIIVHHTGTKVTGVSGAQGTQMDAFGHFGYLDEIWDGEGITSAVLLDAKTHIGNGEPMKAGQQIHSKDIEEMLEAQGLAWRGLLPGDVLFIYTGWGDHWDKDFYYQGGPGLSLDAAKSQSRAICRKSESAARYASRSRWCACSLL
jgi:kynurenine formamidase